MKFTEGASLPFGLPMSETENLYHFFQANQQKANINFNTTEHDLVVNRCDRRIFEALKNRIVLFV